MDLSTVSKLAAIMALVLLLITVYQLWALDQKEIKGLGKVINSFSPMFVSFCFFAILAIPELYMSTEMLKKDASISYILYLLIMFAGNGASFVGAMAVDEDRREKEKRGG